jgi:hypothetical protein
MRPKAVAHLTSRSCQRAGRVRVADARPTALPNVAHRSATQGILDAEVAVRDAPHELAMPLAQRIRQRLAAAVCDARLMAGVFRPNQDRCWWCLEAGNETGEHKFKRTLLTSFTVPDHTTVDRCLKVGSFRSLTGRCHLTDRGGDDRLIL